MYVCNTSKKQIISITSYMIYYPIHKKGDKQICDNYRGIALLNVTYKVLSKYILSRIKPWAEDILGDYQADFRQNRSTTGQIFILKQILQKMWEFDKELHVLFIDFKKANDCIHRESLLNILKLFKLPQKLINFIRTNILHTEIKIKIGNILSHGVPVVVSGLRQGDALSPILFNIVLEKVIRESHCEDNGIQLSSCTVEILSYADDLVLLAENEKYLIEQAEKLLDTAKRVGLDINAGNIEYMIVQRGKLMDNVHPYLEVESYKFKRVLEFKYLGSILIQKNNELIEIKARLQSGNKCCYGLNKVFKAKTISENFKIQLYRTLIRPVVMYGCETWTMDTTKT